MAQAPATTDAAIGPHAADDLFAYLGDASQWAYVMLNGGKWIVSSRFVSRRGQSGRRLTATRQSHLWHKVEHQLPSDDIHDVDLFRSGHPTPLALPFRS